MKTLVNDKILRRSTGKRITVGCKLWLAENDGDVDPLSPYEGHLCHNPGVRQMG